MGDAVGERLEAQVFALDGGKEGVCLASLAEEAAIEAYPLGTTQGGGLHVVGTLYDGDAQALEVAIGGGVLIGREQYEVGGEADDTFAAWGHGAADVCDGSRAEGLEQAWVGDVLGLTDACDGVDAAQLLDEAAVGGGEDGGTLIGVALDGEALQELGFVPGVAYLHLGIVGMLDECEVVGMA